MSASDQSVYTQGKGRIGENTDDLEKNKLKFSSQGWQTAPLRSNLDLDLTYSSDITAPTFLLGWWGGGRRQSFFVILFLKLSWILGIEQELDRCAEWINMTTTQGTVKWHVMGLIIPTVLISRFLEVSAPHCSTAYTLRVCLVSELKGTGKNLLYVSSSLLTIRLWLLF